MSIEARYHEQVRLLVALLPFLNDEPCFALKGGTAINLFVQPFPRLSVDDVKLLLDQGGLDRSVFEGFLVYLLGHPRPVNEVINRRIKPLEAIYRKEFVGMAITDISLPQLEAVRHRLLERLAQLFTDDDARFLLSFKKGEPDWSLFPVQGVDLLPAVMWGFFSVDKMKVESTSKMVFLSDHLASIKVLAWLLFGWHLINFLLGFGVMCEVAFVAKENFQNNGAGVSFV